MKYLAVVPFTFLLLFFLPFNAFAYLGPGLGVGTIGAIIGVFVSVFLGIFAIVYYPIKRLLKKCGLIHKKNKTEMAEGDTEIKQEDNNVERE